MSIVLTSAQNRFLRGQAHDLKALLQTGGKGVTPAFLAELEEVLERHELIKVKVASEDREAREARDAMIADITQKTGSALVQRIGHVAILYRPSKEKRQIVLPRG
ncbi:ribosome assembly RNA-binding protein YhbY [Xanthomonas hortorum]|uniref:ribosome assembly RNA-binding protein YhbY n=1 Tax=Xanthomonas hortorum TaxID=56454 RepID=UPI001E43BD45|nr:ribosome assembly RNA-binding protein YhbY [Xanthomonas hortorum]MCC8552960.1 ribosome assembly RNA-binding protein YhbY [Xanthomonas hortorum pv. gardneri]